MSGSRHVRRGVIRRRSGRSSSPAAGDSDFVLTTMHVFGGTQFTVEESSKPRYSRSDQPNRVVVTLTHGRLRLNPGPSPERALDLRVLVPSGEVVVYDGSVALEVAADSTEVAVRGGRSLVRSDVGPEELVLRGEDPTPGSGECAVDGTAQLLPTVIRGWTGPRWETYNHRGGYGGPRTERSLGGRRSPRLTWRLGTTMTLETACAIPEPRRHDYVSLRVRVTALL